ncbi:kinase-like protein [Myriangium duriaei CBS 260.36]|uniref:non-specific serine/threonine protein kinase n=1 Tax=Myriangium duriaei CBS 260.36 TaxID=1168546 RepID=A0A9P4IQ85_9PEZI|nr:kinase-like protein [Myriangium duriaei CBS 260.36]
MEEEATQLTQGLEDPRRTGTDLESLGMADAADVICRLHPSSPAAFAVVERTAAHRPQHVLQSAARNGDEINDDTNLPDEQGTFILPENGAQPSFDLVLRFSSATTNPGLGFLFGRNPNNCDFILDTDSVKRVSNVHFRIYINESGVLMLQDVSTNGTLVDKKLLRGKGNPMPQTRMLGTGSVIQLLAQKSEENYTFIVMIPPRPGQEEQYDENVKVYLERAAKLEELQSSGTQIQRLFQGVPRPLQPAGQTGGMLTNPRRITKANFGMHWDGGAKYNVTAVIGKGAFATVYQLATKSEGHYFAAKELEKRKFMKNGILDHKLDNEMQIMKDLTHQNIVKYIEYVDHNAHFYIIMEFVGGGDLQNYILNNGALRESMAKSTAFQILNALTYLHGRRITHRDIKPDNILIANSSPNDFMVKLSDFGLSKVVKDNETFLKTFCGTLLYCAPEVFPHWDEHAGHKRTRKPGPSRQRNYHSYSQCVDIWSFGAVLWYSLCGTVPFKGVADNTGLGMFKNITQTSLEPWPLHQIGVSPLAVDLLLMMLNTDPSERPNAAQCLQHPWFADIRTTLDQPDDSGSAGLAAIDEAVELNEEPDLSQLKIDENSPFGRGETGLDSSDFDFLDPRQSKRFKHYESPGQNYPSSEISPRQNLDRPFPQGMPRRPLLFGEVRESLQDPSELELEDEPHENVSIMEIIDDHFGGLESSKALDDGSTRAGSGVIPEELSAVGEQSEPTSLGGAEVMVRDLNVDSPESANSLQVDSDDPRTPRTPAEHAPSSLSQTDGSQETPGKGIDTTPKTTAFNRRIDLPLSASFFYDPHDPATHNPEYASARSGHDFVTHPTALSSSFNAMASATRKASQTSPTQSQPGPIAADRASTVHGAQKTPEFIRPAPRLGRLVSTPESFADITIPLSSRVTTWGRAPNNTVVFPHGDDTRVPKRGLIMFFTASDLSPFEEPGRDWTKMPDLHCLIATQARLGISINGVKLMKQDSKDRPLYGRVYTGDLITIASGHRGRAGERGTGLDFKVEIFHGLGKEGRGPGESFEIEVDRRAKH